MEELQFQQRTDLTELSNAVHAIQREIGKIVVGQQEMVQLLIASMLSDGHVLIEGVPGVAKTLTAKLLARCINTGFSRIQFTPDLMPSDIIGTSVYNAKLGEFQFKNGPIFSNIILIDEVNRAPAKTQSALFEVMEERQITADGVTYNMPFPFMVLATQNPIEHEGTYRLPEAQLDRFLFKIIVPYPSEQEEVKILEKFNALGNEKPVNTLQPVLDTVQIERLRKLVVNLVVDEKLMHFIARLITATRNHQSLFLGASPRASLALLNASKAIAAMSGRDFVIPDDILYVAKPVLRHRIILSPEKEMEGVSPDDVISQIIQSIDIPR
ncbi:MAG: MoxR family ATPase [Chitinophagales bacterium]|nr:MoxR family ATPase [Chitinophagales bacterium]MDW8417777.1 MoxR family ATPase [Chitinophagales bacterium]